jgi:outer membrane murein-binding lipoprotein Lpp
MDRNDRMLGLILICILILTGCSGNQSLDLVKENAQLKIEIESLKQNVEATNNKVKQQEELYELRNVLDNNLHNTLRALIKGDFAVAQRNLAMNMRIESKKLITKTSVGEIEFIIPDKLMNLRQRAFMMNEGNYSAIYEIYDSGYVTGNKYDDRTYTLNVTYSQVNGEWKISSLTIDE